MSASSWFANPGADHRAYSRKQKSLGLLCSNFVSLYNRGDVDAVGLDDAAKRLGVERRRIYDIVNVLESVGVLSRKAKNKYSWLGFAGIPKALDELKAEALKEISCGAIPGSGVKEILIDEDENSVEDFGEEKLSQTSNASSTSVSLKNKSAVDNRKEKSLALLTQNFVKLFLTTKADTISLDESAKLLLGDVHDSTIMRTKVRRLYDIANVLSSLNLIEKTHHADTRKPAFRWLGCEGKQSKGDNVAIPQSSGVTVAIPPTASLWNKRAFGTDITNIDFKRPKCSSVADRMPMSDDTEERNLSTKNQQHGSKGYVFGPFCPTEVTKASENADERARKKVQDWEALASDFRPQYHNKALHDLFSHYMDAWKSWYGEVAQGSNRLEEPYQSIINQLS